jgi:hypothetical protein
MHATRAAVEIVAGGGTALYQRAWKAQLHDGKAIPGEHRKASTQEPMRQESRF